MGTPVRRPLSCAPFCGPVRRRRAGEKRAPPPEGPFRRASRKKKWNYGIPVIRPSIRDPVRHSAVARIAGGPAKRGPPLPKEPSGGRAGKKRNVGSPTPRPLSGARFCGPRAPLKGDEKGSPLSRTGVCAGARRGPADRSRGLRGSCEVPPLPDRVSRVGLPDPRVPPIGEKESPIPPRGQFGARRGPRGWISTPPRFSWGISPDWTHAWVCQAHAFLRSGKKGPPYWPEARRGTWRGPVEVPHSSARSRH